MKPTPHMLQEDLCLSLLQLPHSAWGGWLADWASFWPKFLSCRQTWRPLDASSAWVTTWDWKLAVIQRGLIHATNLFAFQRDGRVFCSWL